MRSRFDISVNRSIFLGEKESICFPFGLPRTPFCQFCTGLFFIRPLSTLNGVHCPYLLISLSNAYCLSPFICLWYLSLPTHTNRHRYSRPCRIVPAHICLTTVSFLFSLTSSLFKNILRLEYVTRKKRLIKAQKHLFVFLCASFSFHILPIFVEHSPVRTRFAVTSSYLYTKFFVDAILSTFQRIYPSS